MASATPKFLKQLYSFPIIAEGPNAKKNYHNLRSFGVTPWSYVALAKNHSSTKTIYRVYKT